MKTIGKPKRGRQIGHSDRGRVIRLSRMLESKKEKKNERREEEKMEK